MATQPLPNEALAVHHLGPKQLLSPTPLDLLRIAVEQGANIELLEKLQAMQERHEKREAKKAWDAAMRAFKAASPRITKNSRVNFTTSKGTTDYRHATLDHVCDSIVGALSKQGISHRWRVEQQDQWVKVTCVLTHELGHAEETSLCGCPDNTGNKNSIQAVGSTVTYLQRYTLLAATGLATSDQDDDGRGGKQQAQPEGLSEERTDQLGQAIANAADVEELKIAYFAAYREADQAHDATAKQLFVRTKDARKRELQ